MKKFKFTLQTVHNVRQMRREKEEFSLMQMQSEAEKTLVQLVRLEEKHSATVKNYNARLRTGEAICIGSLELELNHIAALEKRIRETQATLERQKISCNAQSVRVAAAMREVKITERLRDNQQTRHQLESSRREQTSLDELVSAGFARRII